MTMDNFFELFKGIESYKRTERIKVANLNMRNLQHDRDKQKLCKKGLSNIQEVTVAALKLDYLITTGVAIGAFSIRK